MALCPSCGSMADDACWAAWVVQVDDEEQVMHKLAPLLLKAEGKLQPFHSGFITWLSDPDAAGKYVIDVHSGHAYLGRWAFEVIDFHMRSNPKDWMQNTPR